MDEITRLVESLGRNDVADDEQVLALLALHGRRSVDPLITAASSSEARRRAAAVTALGRIGDGRGRRTVTLALADRVAAVRAAAATALAGYPSESAVGRLRAMLERESEVEVRARAVGTLVEMFHGGTVEALDPLLSLVRNRSEDRRVRLEGLKVLASLPPNEARAIASGLIDDPDAWLARAARRSMTEAGDPPQAGVDAALEELHSTDYFTHRRAASLLASLGEPALPAMVRALRSLAPDAAGCARLAAVIREIARGRERSLAPLLDDVEETAPLGLLVDIIGASRDRTALYHLKGVIDRLAGEERDPARRMIAAKAHYALARAGSRVAYDQLRAMLARREEPLLGEALMAVEEIGGRQDLLDLLAHHDREQGWMKERVRAVIRRVMARSRVRSDDAIFQRLDARLQEALREIAAAEPPKQRRARFVDRL